ncbi:hypothetical protein GCM10009798_34800 [Nocardioides panacihumi]|uniref:PKD domain-containing protein n=1 Tax=Nocardioides panacihumi TaxID=400774 RepID=A0ABP5D031_9ACTN
MFASTGRAAPRVLALLLTLGLAIGVPAAAEAKGKPIRPSAPTDLAIGTVTMSGTSYVVPATWKAGANTTSFQASVLAGTTVLAQANLTATSWAPHVTAKAGTTIKVQIVGVYGKFKGPASSASAVLPDVTAPAGSYNATWAAPASSTLPVTFNQVSLTDDVSAPAAITVSVDFGDGTTATNPVFPLVHDYTVTVGEAKRYEPTVTLKDAAGNTAPAPVNAVVVFDSTAPTGTVSITPASGWARWTGVTLKTTATDNLSPAASIKRSIAWGDGTTTVASGDRTLRHVYAVAGSYTPKVTLTDEAVPANSYDALGTAVVVKKDVFGPTVALSLPRAKRKSVRSWKLLAGTARDAQTAVKMVRVKAVEKRGAAYYAYVPAQHTWVKVGRKTRAFAKAGYLQVATTRAWSVRLAKLTKGVLVYRVQAADVMGNLSAVYEHSQKLTTR